MTYKGHVENGKVVFDEAAQLPEGTRVRIEVISSPANDTDEEQHLSLAERLASVIGKAEGLPEDAAENVDHYLYGTLSHGLAEFKGKAEGLPADWSDRHDDYLREEHEH
jgi:hypothetical protein